VLYGAVPATTVVALVEVGGLGRTLLTRSATNTTGVFYPGVQLHDATGAAIAGAFTDVTVYGNRLRVDVSASDAAATAVTVVVQVEDL
jgi:hypothetical protein